MSERLPRWRGRWDRAAATHLLRRAGFGPAPGEVERAVAAGLDATVDELLDRDAEDPALVAGVRAVLPAGDVDALAAWWTARILSGGAPARERLTLVWHDHFATSHEKVGDVRLMHAQNETLRRHALGDPRQLVAAIVRDPALLVWLDADENRRGRPNENLARELLELFALGLGAYDERDVQEAARALTGLGVRDRRATFDPARHDPGPKRVLGREGVQGPDELVAAVVEHPAFPRHVARRLLGTLVRPEPPAALVEEAAAALVEEGWSVRRLLGRLLRSEAFLGPDARRARVAGPVEVVAIAARALGARVPPREAADAAAAMGQALFRPPSVEGWKGGRRWIDAASWTARRDALARLAAREELDLAAALGAPDDAAGAADVAVRALLPEGVAPAWRDALRRGAAAAGSIDAALRLATAAVLTSPEFHLV